MGTDSEGEMREVEQRASAAYRRAFGRTAALVASAPGRINLIGEHTDYNHGFVLPCAIDRRVAAAVGEGPGELYSDDFQELRPIGGCQEGSWADYPRGVAWALAGNGYTVPRFEAAFAGNVPIGAGLSSSAAIEAAAALALSRLAGLDLPRRELALLCQRAENQFVGVNSGIMDQYASLLCRAGHALLIDCRSLEAEAVPLPLRDVGLTLFVCNTRVERGLAATGYNERRATCERAARELGVDSLRDATLADLERLSGVVLKRARHVITENRRVLDAAAALRQRDVTRFGELMNASHASLRDDYDVSTPQLDTFVELAVAHGALGARLTGAGFGGCAIALIRPDLTGPLATETQAVFAERGYTAPEFYNFYPADGAEIVA